jgi:hypothetical protein
MDVEEWEERTTPRPRFKRRTWGTLSVFLICGRPGISAFDQSEFDSFTIESSGPPAQNSNRRHPERARNETKEESKPAPLKPKGAAPSRLCVTCQNSDCLRLRRLRGENKFEAESKPAPLRPKGAAPSRLCVTCQNSDCHRLRRLRGGNEFEVESKPAPLKPKGAAPSGLWRHPPLRLEN